MDGILLLRKPAGVTSFQALAPIKKKFPKTKIGHCGTLDRFASGLLILLLGRMTRMNPVFSGLDKAYTATFHFGVQTDTLDPEGAIIAQAECPRDISVLDPLHFHGIQKQVPPEYSAIHVNGKRASERMRQGEKPELSARDICIHKLDIRGELPDVKIDVTCSKGTYIRSLARDMGTHAGSCAMVKELERYWIGHYAGEEKNGFFLHNAHLAQDVCPDKDVLSAWQALQALPHIPRVHARPEFVQHIRAGRALKYEWFTHEWKGDFVVVFDADSRLLALVNSRGGRLSYGFVATEDKE